MRIKNLDRWAHRNMEWLAKYLGITGSIIEMSMDETGHYHISVEFGATLRGYTRKITLSQLEEARNTWLIQRKIPSQEDKIEHHETPCSIFAGALK